MASPMQLVRGVAEALGVELSTVVTHDRNLVTEGLRTKGGRGSSAARMSAADAANLLMAVAGSDRVQDSAEAVRNFGALRVVGTKSGIPLPSLRSGHTFGEALTAFMQAYIDGYFNEGDGILLEIQMKRPDFHVIIDFYFLDKQVKAEYKLQPIKGKVVFRDLTTITTFTQATVGEVGYLLRK